MSKITFPALLGGEPSFRDPVPLTRPTVRVGQEFYEEVRRVLGGCMLTNAATVERFEKAAARHLGVKHAVAVSSATCGLMLVFRAMDLGGEVVLPSFTFSATGHALLWNGLHPRFVDVFRETFNLDIQQVEAAITARTKAILAVHVFGNPCPGPALETLAARHRLRLVFDAAHAFGSLCEGRKVGAFGDAEVFSLSPTKLVVAGEGGLVTTDDDELARLVRIGRNYGNPGDYNCAFPGLSARMSEINALLALSSLEFLEAHVERRNQLGRLYRSLLGDLPGLSFQATPPNCRTTYKDFAILVDAASFGMTREHLRVALEVENIATRPYFDPPLHQQGAYERFWRDDTPLPATERISRNVLCLPMFSHMEEETVERVCGAIRKIHRHAEGVVQAFEPTGCAIVA